MQRLLICHEKHFNRYFDASTPELKHKNALIILKGRMEDDYCKWYEYDTQAVKSEIRMILAAQDGKKAFNFLKNRNDEYERIEIAEVDTTY